MQYSDQNLQDQDALDQEDHGLITLLSGCNIVRCASKNQETTMVNLQKNLGENHQAKSFLKKLCILRTRDGSFVARHLTTFDMIMFKSHSIRMKMDKKCSKTSLCSLLDLWNHLVMVIRSTTFKFKMFQTIASYFRRRCRDF